MYCDWVDVKDELPEDGIMVLAYFKTEHDKHRLLRAMYATKHTIEADIEDNFIDYSEKKDEYFLPEGWYEQNEFEDNHWHVNENITHWMPLPSPPV